MGQLLKKILMIVVLFIAAAIPLEMIEGLVRERSYARIEARNDIAASWAGPQQVGGPLLVIPYKVLRTWEVEEQNAMGYYRTVTKKEEVDRVARFTPQFVDIEGSLTPSVRYRGIHTVNTYTTHLKVSGAFVVEPLTENGTYHDETVLQVGAPQVVFAMRTPRGIDGAPMLQWEVDGEAMEVGLQPGVDPELHVYRTGFHAELPMAVAASNTTMPFTLSMQLRGTQVLTFQPVGKDYSVALDSSWPHPKFLGGFLPSERTIGDAGFQAQWAVTELAIGSAATTPTGDLSKDHGTVFGVELFEPVDIYQQSERAAKYGILFVLLTFLSFFLVETLRGARVHFMQYLLVSAVLAMFFLLLISLAEHVGFAMAYGIAAAACALLFGYYVRFVLGRTIHGASFGLGLAVLYGVLYGILQSEGNALLLGSGLVFLALAATIIATRHVDWHVVSAALEHEVRTRSSSEEDPAADPGDTFDFESSDSQHS